MPTTRVLPVISQHTADELQTAYARSRSIAITAMGEDGEEKIRLFPKTVSPPDWTGQIVISGGCDTDSGRFYFRPESSGVIELTPYW